VVLVGITHPNCRPFDDEVPMQSVSKLWTVFGTVDPYNPMTMRPVGRFCMLTSKYTRDVIGAHGSTGPSASSLSASSDPPLNRETAPYPTVPAIANVTIFWSMAEEGDDDLSLGDGFLPPLAVVDSVRWTWIL
jgi:hypothetical protein